MHEGQTVSFETGHGSSGEGVIVGIDHAREILRVIDSDDGSVWVGPMDRAELIDRNSADGQ